MLNCCLETSCLQCCTHTNMLLSYQDIEKIKNLGYDDAFFMTKHQGWLQLKNMDGRCVFHNGTTCSIYLERPEGCTLYPVVYDSTHKVAILDSECPKKNCFSLSKLKVEQLYALVSRLEAERNQRKHSRK
jgi:Fe-S-cluster containining protein